MHEGGGVARRRSGERGGEGKDPRGVPRCAGDAVRGAGVPLVCLVERVQLARAFVCARRRVRG
eukprot:6841065-Prymnesium_polylepis.1